MDGYKLEGERLKVHVANRARNKDGRDRRDDRGRDRDRGDRGDRDRDFNRRRGETSDSASGRCYNCGEVGKSYFCIIKSFVLLTF